MPPSSVDGDAAPPPASPPRGWADLPDELWLTVFSLADAATRQHVAPQVWMGREREEEAGWRAVSGGVRWGAIFVADALPKRVLLLSSSIH